MPRHYSNHRLTRGQASGSSDPLHVRRIRQLERELVNMREERDSWMERVTSNVSDNYFHESRYD
ncbi:32184_t:CDS:2, partial [Racocetra persica]